MVLQLLQKILVKLILRVTQSYPLTFVRRFAIKASSYSGIFSPQISRKEREKYTLRFTPPAYCMFSDDIVSKSDGRNGCSATHYKPSCKQIVEYRTRLELCHYVWAREIIYWQSSIDNRYILKLTPHMWNDKLL